MNAQLIVSLLVAVLAGAGTSLVTGILARPKTKAESTAMNVSAEVSLSADAREWVSQAMQRAQEAEARAQRADDATTRAEHRISVLEAHMRRVEDANGECRTVIRLLIEYSHQLRSRMAAAGLDVPDPPDHLTLDPRRDLPGPLEPPGQPSIDT